MKKSEPETTPESHVPKSHIEELYSQKIGRLEELCKILTLEKSALLAGETGKLDSYAALTENLVAELKATDRCIASWNGEALISEAATRAEDLLEKAKSLLRANAELLKTKMAETDMEIKAVKSKMSERPPYKKKTLPGTIDMIG